MKSVILIGMPSCGKTSIGKRVAKLSQYKFLDTDKMIREKTGLNIPYIFEKYGEDEFRKLETEAFKEALTHDKVVIATGGGIVLKEENFNNIDKDKFLVIYLMRSLRSLTIGGNRPLSKSYEDIKKLFFERKELYEKYADVKLKVRFSKTSKIIKNML